jgi:hypothetical protein
MANKDVGADRPDDYKRYSDIDKEYDFTNTPVGNAVPQSEQKPKKK